jgi:hypothetical protein
MKIYELNEDRSLHCSPLNIDVFAKLAVEDKGISDEKKLKLIHNVARSIVLSSLWTYFRTNDYAGISKATTASQQLKLNFQDFTSKCSYIISRLDPKKSAKVKDEKILLQVRKSLLRMEKSDHPMLLCLSYYGLVAHVPNSKLKEYYKYPHSTPLDEGWKQPNGFDNKSVFNAIFDCDRLKKFQIARKFVNGILTHSINSTEQYFEDVPSDIPSYTGRFMIESLPICKWATGEKFTGNLRYVTRRTLDGEMFLHMSELVDIVPRVPKGEKKKKRVHVDAVGLFSGSFNQKRSKTGEEKIEDAYTTEEVKSNASSITSEQGNNFSTLDGLFPNSNGDNEMLHMTEDIMLSIFE